MTESMFFTGNDRYYIAGQAWVMDAATRGLRGMESASSDWATAHMIPNEAISYVLGRFVEANKANNNKQYFKLAALEEAQSSISFSPVNINHQSTPVGCFVASAMQYPKDEGENPYVEALSAVWKMYIPEAYALIQRAYAEGNLFYSMEAVPESLSTVGGEDDTKEYAYKGIKDDSYPDSINARSCEGIVLNKPHFVGGALIIPPAKPGWSNADVKQMSKFMGQTWETAEAIYAGAQTIAPDGDPAIWEALMGQLMLQGLQNVALNRRAA